MSSVGGDDVSEKIGRSFLHDFQHVLPRHQIEGIAEVDEEHAEFVGDAHEVGKRAHGLYDSIETPAATNGALTKHFDSAFLDRVCRKNFARGASENIAASDRANAAIFLVETNESSAEDIFASRVGNDALDEKIDERGEWRGDIDCVL